MGCDIHMHIEIRYNGKWVHYACPSIDRNYTLFGIMAGVRGEGPAIVEPKGVPNNMSVVTRLSWEKWGPDAHTASWFNEEEIDLLSARLKKLREQSGDSASWTTYDLEYGILNGTYMFGNSLTAFKHYNDYEYLPKSCDGVRMVFWFDN